MSDTPISRPITSHRITLAGTDKSFTAQRDEPLLEAALRQGIFLPYGCKSGACGACRARVISGEVHYEFEPPGLSAEDRAAGQALLCMAQAGSDVVLQARELPRHEAITVRNLPARVETKTLLAPDVLKLILRLPKGDPFTWLPGQYVDLLLEQGERRSFSIANAPQPWTGADYPRIELHLRLTPGGTFTEYAFQRMPEKTVLRLEGPLGGFFLREPPLDPLARTRIFVAGGTGFAPIKAMLEDWLSQSQGQPAHLFWGVRDEIDLYLRDLPRSWADMYLNFQQTAVLSQPGPSWTGAAGWVHEAVLSAYPDLREAEIYASGPPPMIQALRHKAVAHGLPVERLYYDSFDYAWQTWPGR